MPYVGLDIGHGSDTFPPSKGVYVGGKGYAEHDFNAKVGMRVDQHLKRHGFKTVLAQKPNQPDVPLTTRTNLYNREKVDIVWSIHANYNGNKDVDGICCFYWHDHKESLKLAKIFVDEINKAGLVTHGNGLHASQTGSWTNLHIVRETEMTAVLTENGFMSNPVEFKRIFQDPSYIEKIAEVHARTICKFFNITYKPEKKEEDEMLDKAIVINTFNDYPAAEGLARVLKCPIYPRGAINGEVAKELFVCGGSKDGLKAAKITVLSGDDRYSTAQKIADYMKGL
jgi:N-acetylmuramoyl-L-alanine amidase